VPTVVRRRKFQKKEEAAKIRATDMKNQSKENQTETVLWFQAVLACKSEIYGQKTSLSHADITLKDQQCACFQETHEEICSKMIDNCFPSATVFNLFCFVDLPIIGANDQKNDALCQSFFC